MSVKVKQHDITDCGAACLASVASFFQLQLPIARIRQMAGTDKKGTSVLGMIMAAEKMGFEAKGVRGGMDCLSDIPIPAIAHVVLEKALHHFVVIYKIDSRKVEVMDPALGRFRVYKLEEWKEIWSGVLILLAPATAFQRGNHRVSMIKRFMYLLAPHRGILIQSLFGAFVYTILGLSVSIYIQKITDHVLVDGNVNLLNLLSVGMLLILGMQIIVNVLKSLFIIRTGQKIDAQLILGYYKHLLKLPVQFFDSMRIGEITSRISDAVKIRVFINDVAIGLIVNVFIVLFSFGLMFTYYWKLALIMLAIIPIYMLIYWIVNFLNKHTERKLMEHAADLESQLVESLTNVRTIKSFGLEAFQNQRTEYHFVTLLETIYKSALNSVFSGTATEVSNRVMVIVLLWIGSYFVLDQTITPGELMSFYAIIGYFMGPAGSLIGMNKTIQNAIIASDRLFEIMDLERESDDHKVALDRSKVGEISFEEVAFSYGTRTEVYKNFSAKIPAGKITAIVGESGSGKTTLIALLQKLYQITSGSIRIGGYDLTNVSTQSLRKMVAVVPQQLELFTGNVIENIAIGDLEPDMDRIYSISQALQITDFIEALPHGFQTNLGERGVALSGGQKQKLAIARALYRDPEILLLDEATAALDSIAEDCIQNVLRALGRAGKTIVIIAHRLSTIKHADLILVLAKGQLAERGKHTKLLKERGAYWRLWQAQNEEG